MDGWLEVRLLSVHHHPHVLLLGILEDLVQAVHLQFTLKDFAIYFERF